MKIEKLRKKIIINLSASIILIIIFLLIIFYISKTKQKSDLEINQINREIINFNNQTRELESKTKDIKKYKEIWNNIDKNKKSIGAIKMDDINKNLIIIANKHNIYSPTIQASIPENLNTGVFQCKTLDIFYSSLTINFEALSDIKALNFIKDFQQSLSSLVIVTDLEFTKQHSYNNSDFVNISRGKNPSVLKARVSFAWYNMNDKESTQSSPNSSKK